jgi:carbon monoxide dehydrogenase subunit G
MMELEHSFTVPVPPERAWDVLLDVQRVAPCMPGASLDSVDGDDIRGRIKVKVGPISMTYAGTAHFGHRDNETGVIVMEASGKETRGAGTASATVRSQLQGENGHTKVVVRTSLNVTGRPAQFGRGVMAEVGGKLIGIFADNLAAMLAADGDPGDESGSAAGSAAGTGAGSGSPAVPSAAVVPEEPTPPASPGAGQAEDRVEAADAEDMESAVVGAPGDVQARPIEDLNLPVRSYNSLRREGIHTVGDLAFRTEEQLLAISNIGPASVEEIKQKLADYQLSLAGSNIEGTPLAGGTDAPGAPPAPADAAAATAGQADGPGATVPAAPIPAGANGAGTAPAASPAQAPAPAAETHLNLLHIAGPAVLKRAAPVVAGLAAAVVILRLRARRRRHG